VNDYLWDSYAIIELLRGSEAYSELRQAAIITTPFAIVEACFIVQRDSDFSPEESAGLAAGLMEYAPPIDGQLLSAAATWRLKNSDRRRRYSYADAFGYIMAQHLGLTFLTGDRAFDGLQGVEIRR